MTARDSFIEKDLAFNMMMWLEDWDGRVPMPALLKPRPRWTGKQFIIFLTSPGSTAGGPRRGTATGSPRTCRRRTRRC